MKVMVKVDANASVEGPQRIEFEDTGKNELLIVSSNLQYHYAKL